MYKTIIIGAGLSGLTLANELLEKGHKRDELLILESSNRAGGLIKTTIDEYKTEWGPEGLRGGKPGTKRVFELSGAKAMELPTTIPARYIVKRGKLRRVPHGLISAIFTPLVPFFGKIRLLFEPFIRRKDEDEPLESFIKRRFGNGIYPVIDAVVSGIYGGTPAQLSTQYAFPYLKEAEKIGGSVIVGGLKMMKYARKNRPKDEEKVKASFLIKPIGGMTDITDGMASKVQIKYNHHVKKIGKQNGNYQIYTHELHEANNLIIATGVNGTQEMDILGIERFDKVPESLVSIVSLGYKHDSLPHKYEGYGFLSPSEENTFVLGVLFTSQLFPSTAPANKVLLRVYVGGINNINRATMPADELIDKIKRDLEKLMGIQDEPVYSSIQKHAPKGIPQIVMGHEKIVSWKKQVESNDNLFLTGIGWNSIACEALIIEAIDTASKINFSQ